MRDATLIQTQAGIDQAVFRMRGAARLAVDTEFMRERTYYPRLCLVQVATDSDCFLVDPMAPLDASELYGLLADRSKLKILHAARQDLEVLYQVSRNIPGPLFDTQLAAAMLGYPAQIGYADLVASELGHSIDKGQTRTDWSRRPLTAAQLAYAADDVHHLLTLHDSLASRLQSTGRAEWLAEDAATLDSSELYETRPADAWRRLKGFPRLTAQQQAAARTLATWREQRAIDADKPRAWILPDAALITLATALPQSQSELERLESLPPGLVRRRGRSLLELLDEVRNTAIGAPAIEPRGRPTPEESRLINQLMKLVREHAANEGIAPEILATRRDVESLARGCGDSALLKGWRHAVIGRRLESVLAQR